MVRNQSLGRGSQMHLWEGAVWITQEGDARYFVPGGKSFRVSRALAAILK